MDRTKVTIVNNQKEVKIPSGIRMICRRACAAVLKAEGVVGNVEIDLSFVTDEEIRRLNKDFRNIDASTDVLSFPLSDEENKEFNPATNAWMLGDVIISVEHAARQAEEYGHSFQREIAFLTVHSVLHLLGYDHVNGGIEAEIMREKEENVLLEMGLTREVVF